MKKFYLLLLILVFCSCFKSSNEELLNKLENEIKSNMNNNDYLYDLSKLSNFDWDFLYTISPYSDNDLIKRNTGLEDKEISKIKTKISGSDDITLFLFVKNHEIVEYLEILRGIADFASYTEIMKEKSKFKLIKKENWIYVEWMK